MIDRIKALWARLSGSGAGEPDVRAAAPPAAAASGAAAAPETTAEAIAAVLREHIARQSDGAHTAESVAGDAHLLDEGYLDSQSSASLMLLIETRYGVRLAEVELTGRLHSVDALARHVAAARSADGSDASPARGDGA